MATRYSRRLYSYRRQARSGRAYRFPRRANYTYRSGTGRRYRGYGSYFGAIAPYALRAIPYIYRGYKAYQKGGSAGVRRYAGKIATAAAKRAINTVTGYGAYSKVGRGGMTGTQAPRIRNGGLDGGSIIISHKEFIGDIITGDTNTFSVKSFRLNPGEEGTFPWLAQIACNFQQYRFRGLCFHFKTMSADALNSTNTALGTVMMATQYDTTQEPPTTKQQMENIEFAQSCKPSLSMTHFVECAKSQSTLTELYVNENRLKQVGDPRFYDFGRFHIATGGMQDDEINIGELWVSYEIQLYKPMLYDALGNDVLFFGVREDAGLGPNLPVGGRNWVTAQHLDSEKRFFYPNNTLEVATKTPIGVTFVPMNAPKNFLITLYWEFQSSMVDIMDNFVLINCQSTNNLFGNTTTIRDWYNESPLSTEASQHKMVEILVSVDGDNLGKEWGFEWEGLSHLPAVTTRLNLTVQEVPYTKHESR